MPSKDQKIAKPVTWNWDFLTSSFNDDKKCYELSNRQVSALLTPLLQMSWRTRWHDPPENFEEIMQFVGELANALMNPRVCKPQPQPQPEIITEYVYVSQDCEEQDIEPMTLRIVKTATGTYLQDDCGCGEVSYYLLTPASINPATGAVGTAIDVIPDTTLPVMPNNPTDCYYASAGNVFLNMITDYMNGLAGYFQTGSLNLLLGAGVEAAQIVTAILNGNANLNVNDLGLTTSEVIAALTSSGYIDWVSSKLEERNLDGQLTRWNIGRLTQFEVPQQFNIPTPITPFLNYWGLFVNLQELNNQLSFAASTCNGGVNPVSSECWEIDFTQFATLESMGITIYTPDVAWGEFIPGVGFRSIVEPNNNQEVIQIYFDGSIIPDGVTVTDVGITATAPLSDTTILRSVGGDDTGTPFEDVTGQTDPYIASVITVVGNSESRYGWFLNGDGSQFTITKAVIRFSQAVSAATTLNAIPCPT